VQNSTSVFQLNISNKTSFCASISRPNAKPQNVIEKLKSISNSEANKLFLQYSKTNEEIISKINEKEQILLSKFYYEDAKSKSIIKELANKTKLMN
jgi:hypothetical protein